MGMMSKRKGAEGERELARFLTDRGFPARRGQQYSGSPDSPDVVCPSLPFHFEAKRTEKLRLRESMQQAIDDAGPDSVPVVAHKANRKEWLAVMRLSDLLALVQ
jgi:Holliday junction resolvase